MLGKDVKCCQNCKWHIYEDFSMGYVCCNGDSEYVADWTDDDFLCEEWEENIEC